MGEDLSLNLKLHLRKKVLLYVALPVVVVGLLIFGLARQGFLGDWFDALRRATATVHIVDAQQQPVEMAQVVFGTVIGSTDAQGNATIGSLVAGAQQLALRKSGFNPVEQEVTLKRGSNDLGTFTLQKSPAARISKISLTVEDYISEQPIGDAYVTLSDLRPIYSDSGYEFTEVPVGNYKLTVSKSGYNDYIAPKVKIGTDTSKLPQVLLVKTGSVVFESNREGGKRGVFIASYDGTDQRNLVERIGEFEDFAPQLGPNQNKVLFSSTRDGKSDGEGGYKPYFYVVDVDGSNLTKVSTKSGIYDAVWSPDGGYIGFTRYNASATTLYSYNVVTKSTSTFSAYDTYAFVYSGDGEHIAFSGLKGGVQGLFYANSNATGIKKIDNQEVYSLEFTASGNLRYLSYSGNKTNYYEYNFATGKRSTISAPPIDKIGAILSPDGKLRAYVSTRDGRANVYVSGPDGKNELQLTDINKVSQGDLLWAKDSSFIIFNVTSQDETARYLVSTNGAADAKKIVDINLSYGYGYGY